MTKQNITVAYEYRGIRIERRTQGTQGWIFWKPGIFWADGHAVVRNTFKGARQSVNKLLDKGGTK